MITAVVPAAGMGSRLGRLEPKALVDLGGRSLMGHVLEALWSSVDRLVLVVRPGAEPLFDRELLSLGWDKPVIMVAQDEPTGSADAVAVGLAPLAEDDACIVVWADQVGVREHTVARVASALAEGDGRLVLPLVEVDDPYVWFCQQPEGLVVGRRRDGDIPPPRGHNDVGTFGLWAGPGRACIAERFAPGPPRGCERDFVYVLPLLAARYGLRALEVEMSSEALGVNDDKDYSRAVRQLARY